MSAILEAFENEVSSYTEELQNTGNRFSAMSYEELEEGSFDIILTVIPFFNEVVERAEKDERVQSRLDAFRKLDADSVYDIYDAAFDKVVESNERGEHNIDATLDQIVAEYIYTELLTGVRIPGENDPVE
jgi:hypothetical protein